MSLPQHRPASHLNWQQKSHHNSAMLAVVPSYFQVYHLDICSKLFHINSAILHLGSTNSRHCSSNKFHTFGFLVVVPPSFHIRNLSLTVLPTNSLHNFAMLAVDPLGIHKSAIWTVLFHHPSTTSEPSQLSALRQLTTTHVSCFRHVSSIGRSQVRHLDLVITNSTNSATLVNVWTNIHNLFARNSTSLPFQL